MLRAALAPREMSLSHSPTSCLGKGPSKEVKECHATSEMGYTQTDSWNQLKKSEMLERDKFQ